jgi:hypothetical protein
MGLLFPLQSVMAGRSRICCFLSGMLGGGGDKCEDEVESESKSEYEG